LLLEKEKYGFDNYDLAAVTMKVWNMPEIYYQVLSSLKKPENSQHRELTYIVLLSNIFVTEKGINITKYINEELKLVAIDYFGLKQDVLEELDEIFEDIYSKEKELFKL
jgi:hypothetical protein